MIFTVLLVIFLVLAPFKMLLFDVTASYFLFVYKLIMQAKGKIDRETLWKGPVILLSKITDAYGRLFHDYEVDLSNIPSEGPGILILYHGITPCDLGLLFARIMIEKKRKVCIVTDRMAFMIPGIQSFVEAFELIGGSQESCVSILNKGGLIGIYPGGTRESIFSGKNYDLIWGNRKGFANVAVEAKAPIIPIFTKNCRQVHGQIKWGQKFFRAIYDKYKIPIFFIFGLFPVKLKTFIAKPIEYDEKRSVDELVTMTKKSIESMIEAHQKRPATILDAVLERFNMNKIE